MPKGIYPRKLSDPVERFWSKVNKDGPIPAHRPELGPCWLWTAKLSGDGYGRFNETGSALLPHRFAYELLIGPIPAGLTLDHLCRNRGCVNPDHLEPVTLAENKRRGMGPAAVNARKTRCVHGHEYTPENTYWWRGERQCLICMQRRNRARYE